MNKQSSYKQKRSLICILNTLSPSSFFLVKDFSKFIFHFPNFTRDIGIKNWSQQCKHDAISQLPVELSIRRLQEEVETMTIAIQLQPVVAYQEFRLIAVRSSFYIKVKKKPAFYMKFPDFLLFSNIYMKSFTFPIYSIFIFQCSRHLFFVCFCQRADRLRTLSYAILQ